MTVSSLYLGLSNADFTSGGADNYISICNSGAVNLLTTEANAQITYKSTGIFSKFWLFISANTSTLTTTLRFRLNAVNGNETVSIGATATGFFQDTTHTDVIVSGDKIALSISNSTGAGKVTIATFAINFVSVVAVSTRLGYLDINNIPYSTGSTTFYATLAGGRTVGNQGTVEARFQDYVGTSATFSNLYVNVNNNPRGTATTIKSRKNTADGNMSISITASTTGIFEDNTNTDSTVSGDLVNYSITNGSGGGSLVCVTIASKFATTNRTSLVLFGRPDTGLTQAHALTTFIPVGGWSSTGDSTENNVRTKALAGFIASSLSLYLENNNLNGASSLTLRANAANTSLSVSITASTSGRFSDLVNTPSINLNDILTYGLVTGGTSGNNFDLRSVAFTTQYSNLPIIKGMLKSGNIIPVSV